MNEDLEEVRAWCINNKLGIRMYFTKDGQFNAQIMGSGYEGLTDVVSGQDVADVLAKIMQSEK